MVVLLCTDKSSSRISVNLSRSSCGTCSITEKNGIFSCLHCLQDAQACTSYFAEPQKKAIYSPFVENF